MSHQDWHSGSCADAVNGYTCDCPSGFAGDTCVGTLKESCATVLALEPGSPSGVYSVDPDGTNSGTPPISVYCDMTTDGGGYTRVGHEAAGSTGTFKFLGVESGSPGDVANASGNGFFGPRFVGRFNEVRISWAGASTGYIRLHTDADLFVNDVQTALAVTVIDTSDAALHDWVEADGGAIFCRGSQSPDVTPGGHQLGHQARQRHGDSVWLQWQ